MHHELHEEMESLCPLGVRNATDGQKTLTITVVETFTEPISPIMKLNSSLSITNIANGGTITFQSFLNATGSTVLSITGPTVGAKAVSPEVNVSGVASSYTLMSITKITLGAGGSANSTGTATALATPEPATLVSAIVSLPLFGIGAWVRRRRAQA